MSQSKPHLICLMQLKIGNSEIWSKTFDYENLTSLNHVNVPKSQIDFSFCKSAWQFWMYPVSSQSICNDVVIDFILMNIRTIHSKAISVHFDFWSKFKKINQRLLTLAMHLHHASCLISMVYCNSIAKRNLNVFKTRCSLDMHVWTWHC